MKVIWPWIKNPIRRSNTPDSRLRFVRCSIAIIVCFSPDDLISLVDMDADGRPVLVSVPLDRLIFSPGVCGICIPNPGIPACVHQRERGQQIQIAIVWLSGTQTAAMVLAFVLAALTLTDVVQVWHIFVLSALLGVVNAFDMPARRLFTVELVGKEDLWLDPMRSTHRSSMAHEFPGHLSRGFQFAASAMGGASQCRQHCCYRGLVADENDATPQGSKKILGDRQCPGGFPVCEASPPDTRPPDFGCRS